MVVGFRLHFLTFVVTVVATGDIAFANPERPRVPPGKPPGPSSPVTPTGPTEPSRELEEYNLIATPPAQPLPPEASRTYIYPYRQALTPRIGLVTSTDDDEPDTSLLGILYLWPRYLPPQAEIGADFVNKRGGHINFSVRDIFFERGYFRPFWLWGITHEVVPEDRLATFVNIENYYFRVALGMEEVIVLPQSFRLELELLAGTRKQMAIVSAGCSWGF